MGLGRNNASPVPGDARRFAAFISYSHADADAAAKLQRRLERYRLPKRIAETRASNATALGPIFRDREDLAAAASLSAAIRNAIAQAEALIVMCSADGASSPWVAAEIELFRELHPEKPILAALLSGEPAISFPSALIADGNEPLAADLRPEGDGEQLGFLKIVAGIAGVPLDTLIQRDAQRRLRRVTAITAGALAAMLIMGIMTAYALQARNEAARQRASADSLVEFMLTDLREKLRGVGRSEIMIDVNRRALEHYARQGDLAHLSADSLEHRARVLLAIGEDAERAGRLDEALERFKDAHANTAVLLERDPANPDRIFAHAQSEYYVGLIALRKGDRPNATQHWQAYLRQATTLSRIEPDSVRSAMERGYAEGNLCELNLLDKYDLSLARKHCAAAIELEQLALARSPNDPKINQDLANRWGWMARVQMAGTDFDSALQSRRKEAALLDQLIASDPGNVEYVLRRSWATIGEAAAQLELRKPARAKRLLDREIAVFDQATASVTGDARVPESRTRIIALLAKAEIELGGAISKETNLLIGGINLDKSEKLKAIFMGVFKSGRK